MQKGNIQYSLTLIENKEQTQQSLSCSLENNRIKPEDIIAAYMIVYADLTEDKNTKQKETTIELIQGKIDIFTSTLKNKEVESF